MLALSILSTALPLLAGVNAAALGHSRRNETGTSTGVNPGGPLVNATSTSSSAAAVSASTVPTLSLTSAVTPGGPLVNATSTSTNAAQASATSILNDNTTSSEYVACVSDSTIASLVDTQGFNATDRVACSDACVAEGTEQVAYFDDADNLCYCVEGDEAPTSGEVVYAIDNNGTCRSSDDASVEFLYAPYPLAGCYLALNTSLAINTFADTYAVECFYGCTTASPETNATQTVAIRPQLNADTKAFEYQCTCYPGIVDGTMSTDCGFGTYAVYHD